MALHQKNTSKLRSTQQMQEISKWKTSLEAKTLREIFKKIDVLIWARSLTVKSIARKYKPNGK